MTTNDQSAVTEPAMTPERIAEIEARAEAATDGPWHKDHDGFGCVSIGNYGWVCAGPNAPAYDEDSEQGHADSEFIAHARTDVPDLLAYIKVLTEERDEHRDRAEAANNLHANAEHLLTVARAELAAMTAVAESNLRATQVAVQEVQRLRATERQYTVGRQRIADLMGWCARELGASNVHKAIRHFLAIPDAAYPWHVSAGEADGNAPVESPAAQPVTSEE